MAGEEVGLEGLRPMAETYDFVTIGGGAAGFFGAIAFAEARPGSRVAILEKTGSVLGKVKISGGGRCNVTHACFDPKALISRYPRGGKSLIGAFHRWGTVDTVEWFEGRGVELKTEADGRIFPITDSSQTIINCLSHTAADVGVEIILRAGVESLERDERGFQLSLRDGSKMRATTVLVATGGVRNGAGQQLLEVFGHEVVPAAPSLFTFHINDPRIDGLAGLSVDTVTTKVPGTALQSGGPCLVTHWGLSGPAILKLSAWGARELGERDYEFPLQINWTGTDTLEKIDQRLQEQRERFPKKQVRNGGEGFGIPSRLWQRFVEVAGIGDTTWTNLTKKERQGLAELLVDSRFAVTGKSMNKEEFVTAGGVNLKEVNFKTMESRLVPDLYFAGEVLDIDGITGGFNFQSAWTTSKIAGESAAAAPAGLREKL
ncbi:MAG: NAD(P)/FAD-dependent oxidoreductase [Verrucomicrobiota bacterium]